MPALKKGPKIGLVVIALLALFFGVNFAAKHGLLPSNIGKILTPTKANLPDVADAQVANVKPVAYPSTTPAHVPAVQIRGENWEWNAQLGLFLATGGAETMKGSLMEKYGVNLHLERQDDTNKMGQDLLACAKEIKGGATQCSTGANFVVIMGDGAAQFAAGLNPQLAKLGPDYGLKIIGAVGYSRGEDAFMVPASIKEDPHSLANTVMNDKDGQPLPVKGVLVAGVLRDGDWNIALKYAGDNNLPNNPDETTFDPEALNWSNSSDYIQAAKDYIGGKCEDRKEVFKGKLTGKTVHVCINGVVTWTPGDVMVAEQRGGLVKVASSEEYRSQMPSVIIGPGHFFNQNRDEVQHMLQAAFEGADQVKAFDAARHKAAAISAVFYNDEGGNDKNGKAYRNGDYWYKFFKPVVERDAQGTSVRLGGSAVNNLADNKILFGLDPGTNDNMRSTYTVFAAIDLQQYPQLFKENGSTPLPDVKVVEDKSFIKGIILDGNNDGSGAVADTINFNNVGSSEVVSTNNVHINFTTGSAVPLSDGLVTLDQLKDQIAITGLKVKLDGYTDNTGNEPLNRSLSGARAQAVKSYLMQKYPNTFPASRFVSVEGHGPDNPVQSNDSAAGKATNRRVAITLVQ